MGDGKPGCKNFPYFCRVATIRIASVPSVRYPLRAPAAKGARWPRATADSLPSLALGASGTMTLAKKEVLRSRCSLRTPTLVGLAIRTGVRRLFSASWGMFYSHGLAIRFWKPGAGSWWAGLHGVRLDPFAGVVDVGIDADGVDDVRGGDRNRFGLLDERTESEADGRAAAGEKPGGVGVAVDGGVVGDAVVPREGLRAAPAEEFLLEGVAVGVTADAAFPHVAPGRCSRTAFASWPRV